ncbi:MAG: ATP-dependent DNA helicase RecG [Candidatus Omnitrophica bacterium]|nr:ATP-dependent DNA helicase RecG [Candidatus Omnitrophota bacterium]
MENYFHVSVQYLKGIGPKRAKDLSKLGIAVIEDLLYYFPRRYEDRTSFTPISEIKEGQVQTIKAKVLAKGQRSSFRRRSFVITEVAVGDDSGKVYCVWFNQPYLKEYFQVGESLILSGKAERYGKKLQLNSPEFEIIKEEEETSLDLGRLVPVYRLPEGMTQRYFRAVIKKTLDECLPKIQDFLPFDTRSRNNLFNLAKALLNIHFPESFEMQKEAYRRLAFEEFFIFQLPLILRKLKRKEKTGIAHNTGGKLAEDYIKTLPFKLTASQNKVIDEIRKDMSLPQPMQRLLQGDVGSGKTVVSVICAFFAIDGGYQAVFMAPTEILARQHYEKISSQQKLIKTALITGSVSKKEKDVFLKKIKEGKVSLVIGTHALLEEGLVFKNLGLVVIDEQHKFGVGQRALLPKKGPNPDCLIMTATPIPRTLAITLYGDLDVSVINEMPAGRKPVKTISFSKDQEARAFEIVRGQLGLGHQAFIVYPVIEESFALDMAGAKKCFARLKSGEFKGFKLGLIHGKLSEEEQKNLMSDFRNKNLDILVATTVLEVGIDIPNATCMVIEHAERFGLSQLHQLRGRVGRGSAESYCILLSDIKTEEAGARIKAMVDHSDGFSIAEEDLKIRGPGEFFGTRQSGLTELKIANPLTQLQLLKIAREEANRVLSVDPKLLLHQNSLLKNKLLQRFPEYEKLMIVG